MRVENYQKVIIVWLGISPVFQNPLGIGKNGKTKRVLKDWGDAQSRKLSLFDSFLLSYLLFYSGEIATYIWAPKKTFYDFFMPFSKAIFDLFPTFAAHERSIFVIYAPNYTGYGSFHFWPNVPFKLWNLSRRQCCRMQIRGSMYVGMHRLKNKP